ncbi:MAG: HlyD family secretion protein [Hymenobacter sp.]
MASLRNKIGNVAVRQGLYVVRAPQTGFIVRALKAGIGETIKEGESIATLQPESPLLAAELYVRAMDVPLIQHGRTARLQFDGWPAIQFSGWPSAAVGTFGGVVSVIDVVSSIGGKYRLLVRAARPQDKRPVLAAPAAHRLGRAGLGHSRLGARVVRNLAAAQRFPAHPENRAGRDARKRGEGMSKCVLRYPTGRAAGFFSRQPALCQNNPARTTSGQPAEKAGCPPNAYQIAYKSWL